jgi:hypothetical protein
MTERILRNPMDGQPGRRVARTGSAEALASGDRMAQQPAGVLRDYNFRSYDWAAVPVAPLHNASLLLFLARQAGLRDAVDDIIGRLWGHLGRDQVVWGAKWTQERFHSFEFYVYNREEPRPLERRSVTGVRAALTPWLDHIVPPREACNYTMCSFDLHCDGAAVQRASGMHIYIAGGSEKRRHESFSYGLNREGNRLENHYTWYYAPSEIDELRDRLAWSVHVAHHTEIGRMLPQQLLDCLTISYATKAASDGLYFNRVRTRQLAWFANRYLPPAVSSAVASAGGGFDHLMWDVGFDFCAGRGVRDEVALVKFGVYGCV